MRKNFNSSVQDKRGKEGMWLAELNEYCLRNFVEFLIGRRNIDTELREF